MCLGDHVVTCDRGACGPAGSRCLRKWPICGGPCAARAMLYIEDRRTHMLRILTLSTLLVGLTSGAAFAGRGGGGHGGGGHGGGGGGHVSGGAHVSAGGAHINVGGRVGGGHIASEHFGGGVRGPVHFAGGTHYAGGYAGGRYGVRGGFYGRGYGYRGGYYGG